MKVKFQAILEVDGRNPFFIRSSFQSPPFIFVFTFLTIDGRVTR